jgi:hypothetical protein
MKTKVLSVLLTGGMLAIAAWVVYAPNPAANAYEIPEKYRETVHKGLEYLAKNQFQDGHWASDGGDHPVAMTGVVGLALLMETEIHDGRSLGGRTRPRKYSAHIDRAVEWLMKKGEAGRNGIIFSEHPSETARYMEGHGFATLFLAGVLHDTHDEARRKGLNDVLTRAVDYIAKAQSTQGGWHHTSKAEGHDFDTISATIIQL